MTDQLAAADELGDRVDELEAKIGRLELENRVMRVYINHQRRRDPIGDFGGFLRFLTSPKHDERTCDACTALVSTFFPAEPWRGWAL